ncbi:MAG: SpaA isopeptide-forming pilin-related protein, partial [Candidatus Neomarinimicrobiota bacterium]
MINLIKYLFFIVFISFSNAGEKPIKINIIGKVLDHNVSGLKGAKLIIENEDGEELKSEKSGKEGKFKFKKIKLFPGEYTLKGDHKIDGYGEIKFFVDSTDVELTLIIPTKKEEPLISIQEKLPQQRNITEKETLKFEEYFFEYESNLEALKGEIDSLKSVVKGYEKKQTMPNIG